MKIEIEEELSIKPLTMREKLALYFLLTAFWFVIPAKYSHQVDAALKEIRQIIEK